MGPFAKRAWRELLNNFILIALVLSILGVIGTASIAVVLSVTLATLAVIAFGILKNRQTDERIEKALEQVAVTKQGSSASDFFQGWDDIHLEHRIETGRVLSMIAHANHDFVSRNKERLGDFIREGCKIRYILLDPDGSAMQIFAARSGGAEKPIALICLQIMTKLAEETTGGNVQIKLIDHLPFAVITMLDEDTKNGIIFASLCGFNQDSLSRPSFVLHKNRDGSIFEFYKTYFDNLWNWEGSRPFFPRTGPRLNTTHRAGSARHLLDEKDPLNA